MKNYIQHLNGNNVLNSEFLVREAGDHLKERGVGNNYLVSMGLQADFSYVAQGPEVFFSPPAFRFLL